LERVRLHKSRFFASSWANYDSAKPGSLRLSPHLNRAGELARDDEKMEPMFLKTPPSFEEVMAALKEAEEALNGT